MRRILVPRKDDPDAPERMTHDLRRLANEVATFPSKYSKPHLVVLTVEKRQCVGGCDVVATVNDGHVPRIYRFTYDGRAILRFENDHLERSIGNWRAGIMRLFGDLNEYARRMARAAAKSRANLAYLRKHLRIRH